MKSRRAVSITTCYEYRLQRMGYALTFIGVVLAMSVVSTGPSSSQTPPPAADGGEYRLVYKNEFKDPVGTTYREWTSSPIAFASEFTPPGRGSLAAPVVSVTEAPNHGRRFLGEFGGPEIGSPGDRGYNKTRVNQTITLTLSHLRAHSALRITFDLYIIKSWDGDSPDYGPDRWSFGMHGKRAVFDTTFSNNPKVDTDGSYQAYPVPHSHPQTGAAEVGALGYSAFFKDSIYRLRFTIPTTSSTARFDFNSSLFEGKGTSDESWGLSAVKVETFELARR